MTIKEVLDTFAVEQLRDFRLNLMRWRTKEGKCPLEVAYNKSAGTIGLDNLHYLVALDLIDAKRLVHWADTGRWTESIKL